MATDDNTTLFDLVDTSGKVNEVYNGVLYGVLLCLTAPGSSARRWLDTSGDTAPRDGKRALLEVTKRLLPRAEKPLGHVADLTDIKFPADIDPEPLILEYYTALAKDVDIDNLNLEDIFTHMMQVSDLSRAFECNIETALNTLNELKTAVANQDRPLHRDAARTHPSYQEACDFHLANGGTLTIAKTQTAYNHADGQRFAHLCVNYKMPEERYDAEPFSFTKRGDVGLRAHYAGLTLKVAASDPSSGTVSIPPEPEPQLSMHHAFITPPADEPVVLEEPPLYPLPSIIPEPPFHESFMDKIMVDSNLVTETDPEPGRILSMHGMTAPSGVFENDKDIAVIDSTQPCRIAQLKVHFVPWKT
ncbi:hypothetical protein CYMTET_19439 [Cymbomonas tetramitiformis]|uniref:Uncharacterized protein n=1 Tax=Cymbomonas tetramitiformis TaxID=36881 RepID=A0AAE0L4Y6_9CHLO|nr:hypothetical protein CYMTET_19439 [Cymbomonas tetramitiformis]